MENLNYLQSFEETAKQYDSILLKNYPAGIPRHLDYSHESLKWWYNKWAEERADEPYLLTEDIVLDYKTCNDVSKRFGNALLELGLKKGDRVGTLSLNIPQYVMAINGLVKTGMIEVPGNPLYTIPELKYQFNDSGSETILVMDQFAEKAFVLLEDQDCVVKRVIVFGAEGSLDEDRTAEGIFDMASLCEAADSTEPDVEVTADDIVRLQYTGGTTGLPKGCVITHYMAHTMAKRAGSWNSDNYRLYKLHELRVLCAVPIYHVYGWNFAVNGNYYAGGSIVLIAKPTIDALIENIVKYQPNLFNAVPSMIIGLNNHPDVKSSKADLSSVKCMIVGSAPLANSVVEEFRARTGTFLVDGYGMSETTNCLCSSPVQLTKEGSCGIAIPDIDMLVVDVETGTKVLPFGEIGEVICRGPQNITEYWEKPEETAATIRGGWLYTGDIGRFDEDCYLYLLDRKKDIIIVNGFNVYPRDIDELLFSHPKVLEACAVGLPHPTKGEQIKVFIVLQEGESMTADEVEAYCRENLAPYKIPSIIEFTDALTRTAMGKVDRKAIREMELEKLAQDNG